jgi:AsmA family protein
MRGLLRCLAVTQRARLHFVDTHSASWWLNFPRRHPVWTGAVGLVVVMVAVLGLSDWNWAKGLAQHSISKATAREFRIDGNLDVDFFPLELHADRIHLGNAGWSKEKTMARAERLDARVRFWPLLAGRLTVPHLSLDRPYLRLERNSDGARNWIFRPGKTGTRSADCARSGCSRLRIQQLHVRSGQFEFREPTLETSIDLRVESAKPTRDQVFAPLTLNGKGTYRKALFELNGKVDSPLALQGKRQPYRIDLRARAGETRARISGTLAEPLKTQDAPVNFEIRGPDLARIYDFVGIVLPATPPYSLKGVLTRHGDRFSYRDFTGTVGDSDLAGDASLDIGGKRPLLKAVLKSKVLDFDDLAGFVGGTPGTGEGETASTEQEQEAGARRASGKFLPSRPMNVEKLRSMDADVQLTAAQVNSRKLPLEGMTAHLKLVDGQMRVDPLDFGAAGGKLDSVVHVDARQAPATFALDMRIQHLELPKLVPNGKLMQDSIGSISGNVALQGQGDSSASVLATSNGSFGAIMGEGQVSNLLLELAGLDVAEALKFLITGDQQVPVRCAYADFAVVDGVATARSVAFDTTDTVLFVRGDIKLADESLDLKMVPRPKDFSPLALRTPIHIGGTLADPDMAPEGEPLAVRTALVAGLAAIAAPLALLGLIERGPGKDTNCAPEPPEEKKAKKAKKKHKSKAPESVAEPAPGPKASS